MRLSAREFYYLLHRESRQSIQEAAEEFVAEARSSEDTEDEYEFGFLEEPKDELYPCLFRGGKTIPAQVNRALKDHVLDVLTEGGFDNADRWIVFTVYGSGISYNWNEAGDLDIQMWVDVDKYNESHDPMTSDDLVAAVRRLIQLVNFPTFDELGLAKGDCKGKMLIQYYAKPGTGSDDENLASKPYACYQLDEDRWIVDPKPLTPESYADAFIAVNQKAEDIAVQAAAALESLQRNTVDWMFWSQLQQKHPNPKYEQIRDETRTLAQMDKAGVVNLFESVFKGRQEAYAPGGKGIEDERDLVQKRLEVWGIFQRLKHFARQPLPWDEQELPEDTGEDHADDEGDDHDQGQKDKESHWVRVSAWKDLMEKAQRLRNEGRVHILSNQPDHVVGRVEGDHGTYTTQIWREDPSSRAITMWDCECPWDDYAWQRTRQWKKYEGRPCSHALALYWQALSNPPQPTEQMQLPLPGMQQPAPPPPVPYQPGPSIQPDQLPRPGVEPPLVREQPVPVTQQQPLVPPAQEIGPVYPQERIDPRYLQGLQGLYQQLDQRYPGPAPAPGASSQPQGPDQGGSLGFPGALSSWREVTNLWTISAFENGQTVRANMPLVGYDRDGRAWRVPRNSNGEVLSSTEEESVVIFPLTTGKLQPHLVKVVADSSVFSPVGGTPFIRRRR